MQLLVDETGIHRVTYEALRDAGLDLQGMWTAALALTNRGEPVPVHVQEGRGRSVRILARSGRDRPGGFFGPGGFIEFYGEALDTLYTRTNVYQLRLDPRRARRVEHDAQTPGLFAAAPTF